MSEQIQGRIIDASIRGWVQSMNTSAWVADIIIQNGGTSYAYVDGSLALRDASITWLYNNTSGASLSYVDGSLALRDISINLNTININNIDSSVSELDLVTQSLFTEINDIDTSINLLESLININKSNVSQNTSDISINRVNISYLDSSLGELETILQSQGTVLNNIESSLGSLDIFTQNNASNIVLNTNDISINRSNISNNDVSIAWLNVNKLESSDLVPYSTIVYVDGSLAIRDIRLNNHDTSLNTLDLIIQDNTSDINTIEGNITNIESSIGALDVLTQTHTTNISTNETNISNNDVSIAWLNANKLESAALNPYSTISYVDGSLAARDVSIAWLASQSTGTSYEYVDGSLAIRDTRLDNHDTSLGTLNSLINSNANSISDNDVSIAWLNANKLESADLNNYVLISYVDGSLNIRDIRLDNLDTSIGVLDVLTQTHTTNISNNDVSISWLNTNKLESSALIPYSTIVYVDGSLAARDSSITYLFNWNISQDSSIDNLRTKDTNIDTSLNSVWTKLGNHDTSLNSIWSSQNSQDTSIAWLNTNKASLSSPTFTGKPVINNRDATGATYTPATGSQTVALDCSSNNMHIVSGHASGTAITFTVANVTNNQPFIVSILQGGTTVSTIAGWFATIRWAGGTAPTLTATLNKRDTFGFIRTGTNTYDGFVIGQNC